MQATFFQKVILTWIAGFFAACLIWFYRAIIVGGDAAVNAGYSNSAGFSAPGKIRK